MTRNTLAKACRTGVGGGANGGASTGAIGKGGAAGAAGSHGIGGSHGAGGGGAISSDGGAEPSHSAGRTASPRIGAIRAHTLAICHQLTDRALRSEPSSMVCIRAASASRLVCIAVLRASSAACVTAYLRGRARK